MHLLQLDVRGVSLFLSFCDCSKSRCLIKTLYFVRGHPMLSTPPPLPPKKVPLISF